ncbi:MAG: heavy metal translocating P-type ATPase [Campylobacteraceae bacterium]
MKKQKLQIGGMTCVNCSNSIEKVVKKLDGVTDASVNFSTGSGVFVYDEVKVSKEKIEEKINKLGYKVLKDTKKDENEQRSLFISFLIALFGTLVIHFGGHFFHSLSHNTSLFIIFLVASIVQFGAGFRFYEHSYKALSNKTFDMNVLVALGTSAAYFYSVAVLLIPDKFPPNLRFVYFDGATMIITFILLGRYLEARARDKATNFMQTLLNLVPKSADVVESDGKIVQKKLEELEINDIITVKSGQSITLDGVIVSGEGEVDTSMMSGEAMPVFVKSGTKVLGGYTLINGFLHVKVEKEYENSVLASIIELLSDAQGKKMPIARLADKISSIFVPAIILIAILTFIVWFLLSNTQMAIIASISVLIISCPCALGLATPIAIVGGVGKGAKEVIFIKNPEVLEIVSKVKYAIFDKTGTLTEGKIRVGNSNINDTGLLSKIASCEALSEHPLSHAITAFAKDKNADISLHVKDFKVYTGAGISGVCEDNEIVVGTIELLEKLNIKVDEENKKEYEARLESGKSTVIASVDKKIVGFFSFEDTIKKDAKELVEFLKSQDIEPIMLTGDKLKPAQSVAYKIGITKVIAEVLPNEKLGQIIALQKEAKVLFVGDGINDSPSLKQADIGIAMNSGADIAKEAGDIILMKNDLLSVKKSIKLSKNTMKIIHQNLFWAFIYNIIGIPLAAGIFYPTIALTPVYAGIAMSVSSVTVVLNSLRLKVQSLK